MSCIVLGCIIAIFVACHYHIPYHPVLSFRFKICCSIVNSLHVDDLNGGCHTIHSALDFFVKCKERLTLGGFNLRKYQSNGKELENLVVNKFHEEISDKNTMLGLMRNKNSHETIFDVLKVCNNVCTIIT